MYWVLVNIGCLECYLGSDIVGIFTSREAAVAAREQSPLWPEKRGIPDRSLEIFPVVSLDTINSEALEDF